MLFEKRGYTDELLTVAEPFGLWVIESERDISHEFALDRAGLPVLFTRDVTPYKERKVRLLNDAPTKSEPLDKSDLAIFKTGVTL